MNNNNTIFNYIFTFKKKVKGKGINQKYFKKINKSNNWIDQNPYLPTFWGWILYSFIYLYVIVSIIFYIGVLVYKTNDRNNTLDK